MKSIIKKSILVFILAVSLPLNVFAHSGRTNSSGCHTNRKTGSYHCHGTTNSGKTASKSLSKLGKVETRTTARGITTVACFGNLYNCADFSSQSQAQSAFEYCMAMTGKDVHDLDRDNDGVACEVLR